MALPCIELLLWSRISSPVCFPIAIDALGWWDHAVVHLLQVQRWQIYQVVVVTLVWQHSRHVVIDCYACIFWRALLFQFDVLIKERRERSDRCDRSCEERRVRERIEWEKEPEKTCYVGHADCRVKHSNGIAGGNEHPFIKVHKKPRQWFEWNHEETDRDRDTKRDLFFEGVEGWMTAAPLSYRTCGMLWG